MNSPEINPIVIDSRFFDTFKKLLRIILLIIDMFDDDGNILNPKNQTEMIKGIRAQYPEVIDLKKEVKKVSGFVDMATECKKYPDTVIENPKGIMMPPEIKRPGG